MKPVLCIKYYRSPMGNYQFHPLNIYYGYSVGPVVRVKIDPIDKCFGWRFFIDKQDSERAGIKYFGDYFIFLEKDALWPSTPNHSK